MPDDGYVNPASKGSGGNVERPASHGKMAGDSDNESPSKGQQGQENKEAKPKGGQKNTDGYDDAGLHGDFGFSGHKKSSKKGL